MLDWSWNNGIFKPYPISSLTVAPTFPSGTSWSIHPRSSAPLTMRLPPLSTTARLCETSCLNYPSPPIFGVKAVIKSFTWTDKRPLRKLLRVPAEKKTTFCSLPSHFCSFVSFFFTFCLICCMCVFISASFAPLHRHHIAEIVFLLLYLVYLYEFVKKR